MPQAFIQEIVIAIEQPEGEYLENNDDYIVRCIEIFEAMKDFLNQYHTQYVKLIKASHDYTNKDMYYFYFDGTLTDYSTDSLLMVVNLALKFAEEMSTKEREEKYGTKIGSKG